jgi:hypothetical protein
MEGYINVLKDQSEEIAIKFGIANNSHSRIKTQRLYCSYEIYNHSIFRFPTVTACKEAERECKSTLLCRVVTKEEMKDGYTETTSMLNLDKIINIFVSYGGHRV